MAEKDPQPVVSADSVEQSILVLRGHKVLLDEDLAPLYGVEVKVLNQAVRRNRTRFPDDFMFQLTGDEWASLRCQIGTLDPAGQPPSGILRSQIVTLRSGWGKHRKYPPFAFTEQGIAMLSSVLRSERAVQVNIEIMRAFVRLRQILAVNAELARRLDELEKRVGAHDNQFVNVIRAIQQLMQPTAAPRRKGRIGFRLPEEEPTSEPEKSEPKQHGLDSRPKRRPKKRGDEQAGGDE